MRVMKKALICILCGICIASCSGRVLAYMPAPSDDQVMEDPGSDDAVLEDPGSGDSNSGGNHSGTGSGSHTGGSGHSGSNSGGNSGRTGGGAGGGSGGGSQSRKEEIEPKDTSAEDKVDDAKDSGDDKADTDEKKDAKEADDYDDSDNEPIDDKEALEREDPLKQSDEQEDLTQNAQVEDQGEPDQEDTEREPVREPEVPNGTKAVSIASIMPGLKIAGFVLLLAVVVALVFFAIKKKREMPRRPKASPKEKHSKDEDHGPVEARERPAKKAKPESLKVNYEMFRRIDLAPLLSAKAGEVAALSEESSELIGMGVKLLERGDLYDAFKVFYDAMANRSGLTLGEICDVTLANKKMIVLLDEENTSFTPEGKEKLKELLSDSVKKSENLLQMLKVQEESADADEKAVIDEARTKTIALLERYKVEITLMDEKGSQDRDEAKEGKDEDGQGCEGAGEGE